MNMVEVNNVSIRYMTGDFKNIGLKEYVIRRVKKDYNVVEFWANKDINFALEKGDMLGIIGTNGAGKSTLLKAISGIMAPTKGKVITNGTVAALLELGSGFDRELTVRENTYLRGAMLGYTRKFMDETYDSIIDFAELREFQDRPFKQLSSGMKSRLAFSIASLVRPDILILDEVLAVGDGAFRSKSEAKMREVINGGATTILVSHSIAQVRKMCSKVLWLHKGEQVEFGDDVQGICDRYQEFLYGSNTAKKNDAVQKIRERYIASVMSKTGWTHEDAAGKMEDARKRLGITYMLYNEYRFYDIPLEQQAERYQQIMNQLEKAREKCIDDTVSITGWSREYAKSQIVSARNRLGIGYNDYIRYKFYNIPIDQQRDTFEAIIRERKKQKSEKRADSLEMATITEVRSKTTVVPAEKEQPVKTTKTTVEVKKPSRKKNGAKRR